MLSGVEQKLNCKIVLRCRFAVFRLILKAPTSPHCETESEFPISKEELLCQSKVSTKGYIGSEKWKSSGSFGHNLWLAAYPTQKCKAKNKYFNNNFFLWRYHQFNLELKSEYFRQCRRLSNCQQLQRVQNMFGAQTILSRSMICLKMVISPL